MTEPALTKEAVEHLQISAQRSTLDLNVTPAELRALCSMALQSLDREGAQFVVDAGRMEVAMGAWHNSQMWGEEKATEIWPEAPAGMSVLDYLHIPAHAHFEAAPDFDAGLERAAEQCEDFAARMKNFNKLGNYSVPAHAKEKAADVLAIEIRALKGTK